MEIQIETLTQPYVNSAIEAIRSLPEFFYERDLCKAETNYRSFAEGQLPDGEFLIARADERVLGVLGALQRTDADGVYFLASFAVHRECRGGGIGKKLVAALEERLRARNGRLVFAETTSAAYCQATRAFYESAGFVCAAEVPDFWADGDPLALYVRRIRN